MKIRRLGRTSLKVSAICLGTMTFGLQCDEQTSFAIMDRADAGGVFFFDSADVYPMGGGPQTAGRTEEFVGRWLKARGARDRIVLATKCRGRTGPLANDEGLSRKHIVAAVEASLRRLQTDYIDLYQVHSPDAETPIDETLRALDELVRASGLPLARVTVTWVLQHPAVTSAIVGASRAEQLDDTLPATELALPDAVNAACDDAWYNLPRPRT